MDATATTEEQARRNQVMRRILDCINGNVTIKLPVFDRELDRPSDRFALVNIGLEPNEFSGNIGEYRYQFEGEEDLLHLIVTREDSEVLSVQQGQQVAGWVLNGLPTALIWLRPGQYSQHFYFGHDDLIGNLILP